MYTDNCMYCNKVFENMEGKLLIKVNSPINIPCDFPVEIKEKNFKINLELSTNSVFIYDVKEDLVISAYITGNLSSKSEEVKVSPNEFTHLEVNYEYKMLKNQYRIKKLRLDRIEHLTENIY